MKESRFRDDLYYRLNVVAIHLPPLRERPEDVPLLARSFLERLSHELGKEAEDLSEGALKALLGHRWPGNVRELENAVERALVTAKGRVLTEDDFAFLRPVSEAAPGWSVPTHLPLADVERTVIAATLKRNEGNVKETAARPRHRPLDPVRQAEEVRDRAVAGTQARPRSRARTPRPRSPRYVWSRAASPSGHIVLGEPGS